MGGAPAEEEGRAREGGAGTATERAPAEEEGRAGDVAPGRVAKLELEPGVAEV